MFDKFLGKEKKTKKFPSVEEFKRTYGDPRGFLRTKHTNQERRRLWSHLEEVGITKAQGNLPIDTLIYILNVKDLEALSQSYKNKGLKTKFSTTQQPAMMVWDEKMLQEMLDQNKALLEKEGWPTDANSFVEKVDSSIAESEALYEFVGKTFNDPRYR